MKRFTSLKDAYTVCAAIGSPTRLEILQQLCHGTPLNMDTLAERLHLTAGALTRHIKILEDAGLINTKTVPCNRGHQKLCAISFSQLLIELPSSGSDENVPFANIPIGLFSDIDASGACGMASIDKIIGVRDNPKSLLDSNRIDAAAIWLEKGFLTYLLPTLNKNSLLDAPEPSFYPINRSGYRVSGLTPNSYLSGANAKVTTQNESASGNKNLEELKISLEISPNFIGGEAIKRGAISFYLDDNLLGSIWLDAPSTARRGYLTPAWHDISLPQHGSLKLLRITKNGTFCDGEKISNVDIDTALKTKKFTISTDTGFILFGQNFGDYSQGIKFF